MSCNKRGADGKSTLVTKRPKVDKAEEQTPDALKCPICFDTVACAAGTSECGHLMCWVCAHQLLRMGGGHVDAEGTMHYTAACPQCRSHIGEQSLKRNAKADRLAASHAQRNFDAEALKMWTQRMEDGEKLSQEMIVRGRRSCRHDSASGSVAAGSADTERSLAVKYVVSCAPTGRTRCCKCGEAIPKGDVKVCGEGDQFKNDGAWAHACCCDFAADLAAFADGAREGSGEVSSSRAAVDVHLRPSSRGWMNH
eukprot:SAG11_NODE_373_length_10031_cov_37.400020_15_plen_253_part_00